MSDLQIPFFNRDLFGSEEKLTRIGTGSIGGKASGLAYIKDSLLSQFDKDKYPDIIVDIPIMTVIGTDIFDEFIQLNEFDNMNYDDMSNERIVHAFQKGEFPYECIGDLRGLIEKVHRPLAVRSSSKLEDDVNHPFAGVYGTKMIPNNQPDADSRFRKLIEAIKFVYASTYFKEARDYINVTGKATKDEKMAVIIQEVVGDRYGDRYYPNISGVGRTFNFYPFGHAKPEDGVLVLALGLGKAIVDGGKTWSVSPAYPKQPPPYNSNQDIIKQTQSKFWAVNMGKLPMYDPIKETEYLIEKEITDAESDKTIKHLVSTYVADNDRLVMGCGNQGPRVLNFAPLLRLNEFPFIEAVSEMMEICRRELDSDVEVELAATIENDEKIRIGFLQVRKMMVNDSAIQVEDSEINSDNLILSSEEVMGNGQIENIKDIVYIKPDNFSAKFTPQIAEDIAALNLKLYNDNLNYILIGFGRWGSSDPWLGVPVIWSQITNAKVLVEATLPDMDVDLSQGAHFFHNLTSFNIFSFCLHHAGEHKINFDWLNQQPAVHETEYIKHVKVNNSLTVKASTQKRLGVILHD